MCWLRTGVLLAAMCVMILGGCAGQDKPRGPERIERPMPPPSPERIAAIYNPSVVRLDRLWARTELRITGTDDRGEAFDETAEGYFQYIRPRKLALTVKKLGDTYFCLGSSVDKYWWMDLRKPRSALMGLHARATAQTAAKFGVPVHPLDLIDLMGILPVQAKGARSAWSEDGREVLLTAPSRFGSRQLRFTPEGDRLVGVRLLAAGGELLCESQIGQSEPVEFREQPTLTARVPVFVSIRIPSRRTEVAIRLHDPQNRGLGMKEAAFDPVELLKLYNIDEARVRLIDGEVPAAPRGPSRK